MALLVFFLVLRPLSSVGGSSMFKMAGSPAKQFKPEKNIKKITFDDVAGLDEAKQEIMEFVHFLSHPAKYKKLGAKIPKVSLTNYYFIMIRIYNFNKSIIINRVHY